MNAVFWNILMAIRVQLQALPGVNSISIRQKEVLLESDNVVPGASQVVIYPNGTETRKNYLFGGRVIWTYPVAVIQAFPGNRVVTGPLANYLLTRQTLRNTLLTVSPILGGSVPSVFDLEVTPLDVVDLKAYTVGNYDVTGCDVTYDSEEYITVG